MIGGKLNSLGKDPRKLTAVAFWSPKINVRIYTTTRPKTEKPLGTERRSQKRKIKSIVLERQGSDYKTIFTVIKWANEVLEISHTIDEKRSTRWGYVLIVISKDEAAMASIIGKLERLERIKMKPAVDMEGIITLFIRGSDEATSQQEVNSAIDK